MAREKSPLAKLPYVANEDSNRAVRLFPSFEKANSEQRTVAAFLAILQVVPKYGRYLARKVKAGLRGRGTLQCFTEVSFDLNEDGTSDFRADGVLVYPRRKKDWVALLEAKTGDNPLDAGQMKDYYDFYKQANARLRNSISAIITISNEPHPIRGERPRWLNEIRRPQNIFHHFTWEQVLSEAKSFLSKDLKEPIKKNQLDKEQRWLLLEWVRYLEDEKAGALKRPGLGKSWGRVYKVISDGSSSRPERSHVEQMCKDWYAFMQSMELQLHGDLGLDRGKGVRARAINKATKDPQKSIDSSFDEFRDKSRLAERLKIEGLAGELIVRVDFRNKLMQCGVRVPLEVRRVRRPLESALRKLGRTLENKLDEESIKKMKIWFCWKPGTSISEVQASEFIRNPRLAMRDTNNNKVPEEAAPHEVLLKWQEGFGPLLKRVKKEEKLGNKVGEHLRNMCLSFYDDVAQKLDKKKSQARKRLKL